MEGGLLLINQMKRIENVTWQMEQMHCGRLFSWTLRNGMESFGSWPLAATCRCRPRLNSKLANLGNEFVKWWVWTNLELSISRLFLVSLKLNPIPFSLRMVVTVSYPYYNFHKYQVIIYYHDVRHYCNWVIIGHSIDHCYSTKDLVCTKDLVWDDIRHHLRLINASISHFINWGIDIDVQANNVI